MDFNKKKSDLEKLKLRMKKDKSLPLKETAKNLVFGDGDIKSRIMFIGEGPGYWEDQKGIPFVGRAGAFLNQLLFSIKIPRNSVFITNVIHYRPPENRDPLPEELEAFKPYLDKMIKIISPKIIITLGRFSMAKFLPGVTIGKVHGKPSIVKTDNKEVVVLPMYHPAAGLRNPNIKSLMMDDFKKIPGIIEKLDEVQKNEEVESKKKNEKDQANQLSLV